MTDRATFDASLSGERPPQEFPPLIAALWNARNGHWEAAHLLVQDMETPEAAWLHAWLHRKEGDPGNAGYWYTRARRPHSHETLEVELETITKTFVG
ncbi:MAG: hypothetical protein SFU53_07715 [Terrimicrobiaceae bacterium]|nr:hypothetical protein [Terrimicrobiaceae bacterium]